MANFAAAPAQEDTFEYQRIGTHDRAAVCLTCSSPSASELLDDDPRIQAMARLAEQDREKNHD